jgi:Mn2+/Fe2+ NRAMP family transporter
MTKWLAKLGPGLMLAAAAVGVSHLVQSTRTGADFGLSFIWVIILIAVIKYPAFRFAVDYASHTDRSLVHGYARLGRVAEGWLFVAFFIDMFVATAAVALVTAGLLISVFGIPYSPPQVALAVVVVTALVLLNGSYTKAEGIVKALVAVFSVLTIIATLVALPKLGSDGRDLFGEVVVNRSLVVFLIAITGWMPLPMTGSIFLSMWAKEKRIASGGELNHKTALQDLRFGWALMIVLAICFVLLGAAVLFQTDRAVPPNAAAFATELLGIFTSVIGSWAYPVIALAAIAVMWSSVFALMDAVPRVTSRLFRNKNYTMFLAIQIAGVSIVLLLLMKNFGTFIDFATSAGFITAPAVAYYNYRAVMSDDVSPRLRPSGSLLVWHWVSLTALTFFALAFFVERLSG